MKTSATAISACLAIVLGGCGEGGGILIRAVPADQSLKETTVQSDPGWVMAKVALVDVTGLILNEQDVGLLGLGSRENPISLLAEKLEQAKGDGRVKAVILRINSPGGTVQASETMHGLVARFASESGKPVIACITDVGASGGYYLACAARRIICQPSSITGSIGVLIQTVSFAGTMKLLGISAEAIASGPLKTMGSPLKDLTEEERKVFQAMVSQFYEGFVDVVAKGRGKLPREKVRQLADGRVYTGKQALELGLVDELGGLPEALAAAKQAAGLDKANVVMYHRPLGYRANAYSSVALPSPQINLINIQASELLLLRRPSFLYLWSTDLTPVSGK